METNTKKPIKPMPVKPIMEAGVEQAIPVETSTPRVPLHQHVVPNPQAPTPTEAVVEETLEEKIAKLEEENKKLKSVIDTVAPYFRNDIPKEYVMGGVSINVENKGNSSDVYGRYSSSTSKVELFDKYRGEDIAKDKQNLTFYHELVHSILDYMEEVELYENEKFVSLFAQSLRTFLFTRRFE